jgi:hypothetical protein
VRLAFDSAAYLFSCGDLWMVAFVAMWLVHSVTACHAGGTMVSVWFFEGWRWLL